MEDLAGECPLASDEGAQVAADRGGKTVRLEKTEQKPFGIRHIPEPLRVDSQPFFPDRDGKDRRSLGDELPVGRLLLPGES